MLATRRPERALESRLRLIGIERAHGRAGRLAFAAWPAGERHQRDVAFAGGDRLRRMRDMDEVGAAPDIGRVDVPNFKFR